MSTRCVVTCVDSDGHEISIYRHSDGYPEGEHGVLETLKQALSYAWPLPRYEADDFAAAIVAAWKKPGRETFANNGAALYQGGYIRLMRGGIDTIPDAEYHYVVQQHKQGVSVTTYRDSSTRGESSWVKSGTIVKLSARDQPPVEL